jgi:hypothetical protein
MIQQAIARLEYACDTVPGLLRQIDEDNFSSKPAPDKWSKKEILGHLIDSATNNHQRFVRVQFEDTPHIVYKQDQWNAATHYNQLDSEFIISFWLLYNRFIIKLVKNIPPGNLARTCNIGGKANVTLEWLIADYADHMEHHLKQIL